MDSTLTDVDDHQCKRFRASVEECAAQTTFNFLMDGNDYIVQQILTEAYAERPEVFQWLIQTHESRVRKPSVPDSEALESPSPAPTLTSDLRAESSITEVAATGEETPLLSSRAVAEDVGQI